MSWFSCPRYVCLLSFLHPSVTDPVKADAVDFFHLSSENLASLVPDEYLDFTQLLFCFPGGIFTYPAYFFESDALAH